MVVLVNSQQQHQFRMLPANHKNQTFNLKIKASCITIWTSGPELDRAPPAKRKYVGAVPTWFSKFNSL